MKYHFIGDQGISMRGLKEYVRVQGSQVSGSDLKTSGHHKENVTSDIDVVVRTSAVSLGSPGWIEVESAVEQGIPVIKRSELLGDITRDKKLIAISGMHGKTTVTSLVGLVMIEAGLDPTVLVGEEVKDFDGVIRIGRSEWFVAEVCEYDRSFLDVEPYGIILTNIEEEHLDTYPGGLKEIKAAFGQYLRKVHADGFIIACADDENVVQVINEYRPAAKVIYYGRKSDTYNKLDYKMSLPGNHNVLNALAVIALADILSIAPNAIRKVLETFRGAHRRFEYKGLCNGAVVIDDYGHHPTEIQSTIQALSERYPEKRKIVVFWPHQFKRIKPLLNLFGNCFTGADEVIIKPIFFVPGRDEQLDVSASDIVRLINQQKAVASVMEKDEDIVKHLRGELNSDSVVLTIGIPPVYKIADALVGGDTK